MVVRQHSIYCNVSHVTNGVIKFADVCDMYMYMIMPTMLGGGGGGDYLEYLGCRCT